MEREDWNWIALLCLANLFAGIISSIYQNATGKTFNFWLFLLTYGVFYMLARILFSGTTVFNHTHFCLPILIYTGLAIVAAVITAVIQSLSGITMSTLVAYIILAIFGIVSCVIGHITS